jgi:hypothetical protein
MLGYASSGTLQKGLWTAAYHWYQGYFFNDEFQVSRKLTLNYGVRWELPGSLAERNNLASVFLPNAADPLINGLKGYQTLVNSSAYPDKTITQVKNNLFAPRFGFAYRITDMTVLRGGYGISYLPNNFAGQGPGNSPIVAAATGMLNSYLNQGSIPYNTMANPFPASGSVYTVAGGNVVSGNASTTQSLFSPAGRNQAWLDSTQIGGTPIAIIPDVPYPYVQLWNVNFERQLPGNLMFEIGYAGSKGTHLLGTINSNQISDDYLSLGSALGTPVANPFYGILNSNNAMGKANTTRGQLLRPYPQWLDVANQGAPYGSTSYNAMTVKLEKRFGSGGVLMGNYTWAKLIGDVDSSFYFMEASTSGGAALQNYNDRKSDRALLAYNLPHRVKVSYVLDLPFGKGKKFGSGLTGAADKLVSGWGINGIVSFQTGFPLAIFATANTLQRSYGGGVIRPMYVNGCTKEFEGRAQDRLDMWFNTACFIATTDAKAYGSTLGQYRFGNEARVDPQLSSQGVNNWDLTILKNTRITERVNLQFRTEVFNLFNRVQFYPPGTQLGTAATYGKVQNQLNAPRNIQFALRLIF